MSHAEIERKAAELLAEVGPLTRAEAAFFGGYACIDVEIIDGPEDQGLAQPEETDEVITVSYRLR